MRDEQTKKMRSDCPVNFAVEILGDKWSLVILRDIIFWGKKTYGEFLKCDEKIATNILAARLESLEKAGLIQKSLDETDRRKDIYSVTEKGIDLIPLLIEIIAWSAKNDEWQAMERNGTIQEQRFAERSVNPKNKDKLVKEVKDALCRGSYIFEGVRRTKKA